MLKRCLTVEDIKSKLKESDSNSEQVYLYIFPPDKEDNYTDEELINGENLEQIIVSGYNETF